MQKIVMYTDSTGRRRIYATAYTYADVALQMYNCTSRYGRHANVVTVGAEATVS